MSTASPSPRRLTRKGQATRQRIVSAAADLIFERGVAHTTIDDVRAAADVSSSQLYHYFDDKAALVSAVIEHQTDAIVSNHDGSISAPWRACAPGVIGWSTTNAPSTAAAVARSARSEASSPRRSREARTLVAEGFKRWETAIQNGLREMQAHGRLAPDADPDSLALALLTALQGGLLLPRSNETPRRWKPRSMRCWTSLPDSTHAPTDQPCPDHAVGSDPRRAHNRFALCGENDLRRTTGDGAKRDRTADLRAASAALFQLSYSPVHRTRYQLGGGSRPDPVAWPRALPRPRPARARRARSGRLRRRRRARAPLPRRPREAGRRDLRRRVGQDRPARRPRHARGHRPDRRTARGDPRRRGHEARGARAAEGRRAAHDAHAGRAAGAQRHAARGRRRGAARAIRQRPRGRSPPASRSARR